LISPSALERIGGPLRRHAIQMQRRHPHHILLQGAVATEKSVAFVEPRQRVGLAVVVGEGQLGFPRSTAATGEAVVPAAAKPAAAATAAVTAALVVGPDGLRTLWILAGLVLLRPSDAAVMGVQARGDRGHLPRKAIDLRKDNFWESVKGGSS